MPLNVQDYGPYLGQIRKDADAVFVNGLGRWTLLFAKQYAETGLKGKIPLIANGTYTDEHVLPQLGDESIGVISAHHYSAALETPANQKFRAAYEKVYQRLPGFYGENCYTGARMLNEAVKANRRQGRGSRRPHGRAAPGQDHRCPTGAGGDGRVR